MSQHVLHLAADGLEAPLSLAVGTLVVLLEPLVDAHVAEQFFALASFALHGIVDGMLADQASHVVGDVVVEVGCGVDEVLDFIRSTGQTLVNLPQILSFFL